MFTSSRSGPSSAQKQDEDPFKSILITSALRQEFTLLVLECTNHMRSELASVFSASYMGSDQRPSIRVRAASSADIPPSYETATQGRGRQDYDRKNEELSNRETLDLKRQAGAAMNAWRTKVLRRVGEALGVKAETVLAEKARRDAMHGEEEVKVQPSKHVFYASVSSSLTTLEGEKRETLLSALLLLLLSLETYSAYSRVLLCHVCQSLQLPQSVLYKHESTTAKGLLTAAESMTAEKETAAAANNNATGRAWKVGLATVAGAALIGVTGGLAAPFLAAGVGGIFGAIGLGGTAAAGLLGGLAGNVVLIGGLFGAYGGRMTGGIMDKYAAEISDFAFLALGDAHRTGRSEQKGHHLRVGITISGWLTTESEVVTPWQVLSPVAMESFALRWELSLLLELGTSLAAIATSYVWSYAQAEILNRTILATLAGGLWPLGLVRVARIAENPFSIALVRADKAGELLADALINRAQGERPVNLIGYSLGGRVIYSCLQSLARRQAFGLVENAVLIGAPCPSDAVDWRNIRAVTAGRVVNVYSMNDFILAFLYRTSRAQFGVAGIEAIEEVAGVESWDASVWVSGHTRYRYLIGKILQEIGFDGVDENAVVAEAERLKEIDAKEAEEKKDNKPQTKRQRARKKDEDLIDFGENENVDPKDTAQHLSDKDIEDRVERMGMEDRLLDDETVPALPPRQPPGLVKSGNVLSNPVRRTTPTQQASKAEAEAELQALDPEPFPISDDEISTIQQIDEDSEDDQDPFASQGIRMIDAEDAEAAEREAQRVEQDVRQKLKGLHV